MRIFIYFLIAFILGVIFYFIIRGGLTKQRKIIISILFFLLFIIIGVYTAIQDGNNKKDVDLIAMFVRGEVLKCGDIEVKNDKFNFSSPTLSFIGKKDTEFHGKIISIRQCY